MAFYALFLHGNFTATTCKSLSRSPWRLDAQTPQQFAIGAGPKIDFSPIAGTLNVAQFFSGVDTASIFESANR
jgi:hypothetical protein